MIVQGILTSLEAEITPANTAYEAGDVVGGLVDLGSVPGAAGGVIVNGLALLDDDNEGAALDVHLFDEAPAAIADHAAFEPTIADLVKRVAKVAVAAGDYETLNSLKVASKADINQSTKNNHLWAYLVCSGTPEYAAGTKITLRAFVVG